MGQSAITLVEYAVQYIHILLVYDEGLKGGIRGYSFCLLANLLKLQLLLFGCKRARASITSELK